MSRRDLVIIIIIYAIGFGIVFGYGITHPIVNDGVVEYADYQANIIEGWKFRYSIVNSCIVTIWLPAMIQRVTHADPILIFRLIPSLLYPLMPAFAYLIARKYLKYTYAMTAVAVIFLSSYFIYYPDMGRVGAALGVLAVMLWALIEKKVIVASIFAVVLVFTHYGTALVAIAVVGFVFVGYLVWNLKLLKQYMTVLIILVAVTIIWHYGVAAYSGKIITQMMFQTEQVGQILPVNPNVLDINTREPAVQAAIGINGTMPIPQILEILINWLMVGMITIGLVFLVRKKEVDIIFKIMAIGFYSLIVLTVLIPYLSTYYGGMRVYFTSTMILAVGYPLAAEKIGKLVHLNPLVIGIGVLVLYGLATSGLIYLPFGMEKTFPVVLELK